MNISRYLIISVSMIALIFALNGGAYANGDDDNTDRLTSNQNYTFSAGYINAAKQQTDAIRRQESPKKSLFDRAVEYVQNKLANKVEESANDKAAPELKKRVSAAKTAVVSVVDVSTKLIDSTQYNINIGTGTKQARDGDGRLISEVFVIDGKDVKHIYAGFDNYGKPTIQAAMSIARPGDYVIVRGGGDPYTGTINIRTGVNLYGGYNEDGIRDLQNTPTIIGGTMSAINKTEINGFTFNNASNYSDGGLLSLNGASNITVVNNIFNTTQYAYFISYGSGSYSCGYRGTMTIKNSNKITIRNNVYNGINAGYIGGSTHTILEGNIFDIAGPFGGWASWLQVEGGNLDSFNNNFNVAGGFAGAPTCVFSSTDDYFAPGSNLSYVLTLSSPRSTPNTETFDSQMLYTQYTSGPSLPGITLYDASMSSTGLYDTNKWGYLPSQTGASGDVNSTASIFKNLLAADNSMLNEKSPVSPSIVKNIVISSLGASALSLPGDQISPQEMDIAMRLAAILSNPTQDQKFLIDSAKALLQDMNKAEKEAEEGTNPDLKKASDNLIQALANILLAQAIPDLLKEGDISNIKGIFKELDTVKSRVMREYEIATTPYYEKVKKDIMKNVNVLQLNNIISNTMAEEELRNMQRSEIDKIMDKLKKIENRSFEGDYILQQESKYRKEYIDPNKKKLEYDMKALLQDTTKKLNRSLGDVVKK